MRLLDCFHVLHNGEQIHTTGVIAESMPLLHSASDYYFTNNSAGSLASVYYCNS